MRVPRPDSPRQGKAQSGWGLGRLFGRSRRSGTGSRPPGRRGGPGRTIGLIALVVLGFVLAGAGGTGAYYLPVLRAAVQDTGRSATVTPRAHPRPHPSVSAAPVPASTPAANAGSGIQPFTVLLLGSDNDGKNGNDQAPLTQSVILVRVNPQSGSVVMLSLPRDLVIDCYDSSGNDVGPDKLDACFTDGTFPGDSAAAMVQTIEDNFGIQVDAWAWIGLQGLVNLIDYVGGVDVVVTSPVMDDLYPADVGTQNAYGYQRLAILPGPQHMNGEQALNYVRTRHASSYGDFSRSARQQQVLVALREKLQNLNPADLPQIENAMQGQFYTSMSLTQMARLLPLASRVKNSAVTQLTLASTQYTSEQTVNTADGPDDVVYGDYGAIDQLIWQYFPEVVPAG